MGSKKPWNIPDVPIYSIATQKDGRINMNICTYVSPVSMKPKRYIVAVYYPTLTFQNIQQSKQFVLQLLSEPQANIIRYLGQKSGLNFNKNQWLMRQKEKSSEHPYFIEDWQGFQVLSNAKAHLLLSILDSWEGGDHQLFLCEVVKYKVSNLPNKELTLNYLRDKKLVRM
jgi:flavin reductase (DIM6/NTAB) family NADH-FMN oxidoreductase RutF